MCLNIIAVVGALFRPRPSEAVSMCTEQSSPQRDSPCHPVLLQQCPAAVPSCTQKQLGQPWDSWSLRDNFQQSPAAVPLCDQQQLGPPWDSWSLGVYSQQSPAAVPECDQQQLGPPWDSWSLGFEDEDNSEMIIYREIAELCVELNLPPESFNIDHSDWGLREILSHLKKLKANKEAGQPSSQLSIPFICKVPEGLLAPKQPADKPHVTYIGPIHSNHELKEGRKKANKGKNILFSGIDKFSKWFK